MLHSVSANEHFAKLKKLFLQPTVHTYILRMYDTALIQRHTRSRFFVES